MNLDQLKADISNLSDRELQERTLQKLVQLYNLQETANSHLKKTAGGVTTIVVIQIMLIVIALLAAIVMEETR